MAKRVHVDDIGQELTNIVETFIRKENKVVVDVMPKVARVGKRSLRNNSPGSGEYASGWRVVWEDKYRQQMGFVIWNPKHYRLTHLLENGHLIKNQFGGPFGKGRTSPQPHVATAQREANEKVIELLKKEL